MPRTIDLVRVKTAVGERVYLPDAKLYAHLGGDAAYMRKYVGDVSEGEMVLWHNESIDKTLEEIVPSLLL